MESLWPHKITLTPSFCQFIFNLNEAGVAGTFFPHQNFPPGKKVSRLFFPPGEKLPDFRHFFPRGKESERGKKVPVRVSIFVWFLPPEEKTAL